MGMVEIGKRERHARNMRGLTLQEVADALGFVIESVAHIESGSSRPSLQTFIRLGEIFDVSLDYLSGRTASPLEKIVSPVADRSELTDDQLAMLAEMVESLIPFVRRICDK